MARPLMAGCLVFFLGHSAHAFSADHFGEIDRLLANGQYQQAYELALQQRVEFEGDSEFDYLYAVACAETGEYHEAIFAFERVLSSEPSNLQARLGLAKSYYHIGELQTAKKHLEIVSQANPPANIGNVVDSYLANISGRNIAGAVITGYANVSVGHDSNVNGATSDQTFTPALGAPVAIAPGGRQRSDMFRKLELGGSYLRALRDDIGLEVHASISDKDDFSSDTYDQDALNLSTTLVHSVGNHLLSAGLGFRKTDLDGRDYQEVRSLNAGWAVQMSDEWSYQTGLTYNDVKYPDARFRDQRQQIVYAGLQGGFTTVTLGAGLIAGFEEAKSSNSDQWARDYVGYYLDASMNLDDRHRVFGRWYSHKGIYDARMPVFNTRRDETYDNLMLGFSCQMSDKLRLALEYSYSDNDSNIDFFSYDRQVLQTSVRYQF